MADYNRSTRELTSQDIPADVRRVLTEHIEFHNLRSTLLQEILIAIESKADKIKKGMFTPAGVKSSVAYVIVTKTWLFDVVKPEGGTFSVLSARLANITVTDYEKDPAYSIMPDTGVFVNGTFTDAGERASKFIGLGKEPAGARFKEVLIQAVQDVQG